MYSFLSVNGLRSHILRAELNMSRLSASQRGQLAVCVNQMRDELQSRALMGSRI
jgi:hypothetical protein